MGATIGNAFGGIFLGSMAFNEQLTIALNVVATGAIVALAVAARAARSGISDR